MTKSKEEIRELAYQGYTVAPNIHFQDKEAYIRGFIDGYEKAIQVEGKVKVQTAGIADCVPTNWLDPLLTGKEKVIGEAPYNSLDIQNLLLAVKERIKEKLSSLSA